MSITQVGHYEIIRDLGQGSMATVHLARDTEQSRLVAVKIMSPDLTDPTFEGRFRFEAELLATADHPYIVPVYDFGTEKGRMYIVMRYMAGGTLMDRLRYRPLPPEQIISVFARLGDVLDQLHAKGIIHRDLKPGNILFDEEENAFLGDFGIAKNIIQPGNFTATDVILGTVDYMSPEQIHGVKDLNGRTDIYALGILLFYALTGVLPFKRETIVGTAMAHLSDPIPNVQQKQPDSDAAWDTILQKALAKDRADRYSTAGEMVTDIKNLIPT